MEKTVLDRLYEIKDSYMSLENTPISKSSDYSKGVDTIECLIGEQWLIDSLEGLNHQKTAEPKDLTELLRKNPGYK